MGNVLRGNFGKRKGPRIIAIRESGSNNLSVAVQPSNEHTDINLVDLSNIDIQVNMAVVQTYLNSLKGYSRDEENISLRRQTLKNESVERLTAILKTSDKMSWNVQPSFYQAVIDELKSRQK